MKGKVILATVAIAIMVAGFIPQSEAYTWYSNRNTVTVPSYNVSLGWINASWYYGDWVSGADENMTGNWSMPTPLNETSEINMKIYNNGSDPIHCNLTINGRQRVNNSTTINSGIEFNVQFEESLYTDDYFNMTFNCNSTDVFVNVTIKWVNATVTKTEFITGRYGLISSIKERYKTHPEIKFDKSDSWYTVEDKITVDVSLYTNFTLELYNTTLNISYPSHAVNQPYSTILIDVLNNSMSAENYLIGYQKKGPYVSSIGTPQQNAYGDYELGMRIKAYEDEKDCTWEFDPSSSDLSEYFPYIDLNTLEIEIDGSDVDFEIGSITIEDIDLDEGLTSVDFTWTPTTITPVAPTEGINWFTWLVIGLIISVCIILIAYIIVSRR